MIKDVVICERCADVLVAIRAQPLHRCRDCRHFSTTYYPGICTSEGYDFTTPVYDNGHGRCFYHDGRTHQDNGSCVPHVHEDFGCVDWQSKHGPKRCDNCAHFSTTYLAKGPNDPDFVGCACPPEYGRCLKDFTEIKAEIFSVHCSFSCIHWRSK